MEECLAVAVAVAAITASSPRPPIAKPSQGAGSVSGWWWVEDGWVGGDGCVCGGVALHYGCGARCTACLWPPLRHSSGVQLRRGLTTMRAC